MTTRNADGFLPLVMMRPPWLAIGVAIVAVLASQAPDPTAVDATGQSLRILALPLAALAAALALPTVLRVLSQRRALQGGHWIKAKVTGVEVLRSGAMLPRHRILWTDPDGRAGRSLVITKRWVPPKGSTIRVLQDDRSARQWWEGDLPGALPAPDEGTPAPSILPSMLVMMSWPSSWIALFAAACAALLAFAGTPGLLVWPLIVIVALAGNAVLRQWRALVRALRFGKRINGKVTGHFAAPVSSVGRISSRGPRGAAMRWETKSGHFGETDYVAHDRVVAIGQSIPLRVDPITGITFWEGSA
ncbi:MAG: hypothetical protein R3D60_09100 [Paracoccaceae bacterium]